jgi:hypothetical protein
MHFSAAWPLRRGLSPTAQLGQVHTDNAAQLRVTSPPAIAGRLRFVLQGVCVHRSALPCRALAGKRVHRARARAISSSLSRRYARACPLSCAAACSWCASCCIGPSQIHLRARCQPPPPCHSLPPVSAAFLVALPNRSELVHLSLLGWCAVAHGKHGEDLPQVRPSWAHRRPRHTALSGCARRTEHTLWSRGSTPCGPVLSCLGPHRASRAHQRKLRRVWVSACWPDGNRNSFSFSFQFKFKFKL